jgi:hypothetical protein
VCVRVRVHAHIFMHVLMCVLSFKDAALGVGYE